MIVTPSMTLQKSFRQARSVYLLLAVLFLVGAAATGYFRGRELLTMREVTVQNETRIAALQTEKTSAQASYAETRVALSQDNADFARLLEKIIPAGERYTEFTRSLDEYFAQNLDANNSIVASNLRFGKGEATEGLPFFSLPTSLTITSSKDNFFKFLRFVEQSGSTETATRLMDIQGIRVNFGEKEVSFTVDLRAFYRNVQ